jgi:two-component system sensor histidine kinase/response regulator
MPDTNGIKILVIDDEPGIREGCRRALVPQGYAVQTAENGEEGMKLVLSDGFDLALIDVMMPGTSGLELISMIHGHDPDTVCIIITGYATVELAVSAIKQGAYDFLTKPFTTDDLLLVVNQGLERRQLTLETRRLQSIEVEAQRLAAEKARLEELDRAKVAFIHLATHELQAPISAILTYLDLMLNGYIPVEEQRETLERIQERAKELLSLDADLLEFGRLKEIQATIQPKPLQLEEVLQKVLEQLAVEAQEKDLAIQLEIASGLPPVCLAADQARSVWTNLITNAIKYTPAGGELHIRIAQEAVQVLGQVSDTGIGIPDDAKTSLFSEFFRAKNAKALNIPGTGLGLAIVKQIIEKAGGKIWVESQVDQGSTFSFVLPSAPA